MRKITVERSIHIDKQGIEKEVDTIAAWASSISYVSTKKNKLVESVYISDIRNYYFRVIGKDNPDKKENYAFIRSSEDNGYTWEKCEDWQMIEVLGPNRQTERGVPDFFLDPDNGFLLRVSLVAEDNPEILPWRKESPVIRTRRIYTQISKDEGKTWNKIEQLVLKGKEFDSVHWAKEIWYGKNSGAVEGSHAPKLANGTFLIPHWMNSLFEDGTMYSPDDGFMLHKAGCFIGRWQTDGNGIDWDQGEYVTLPRKFSADGADEPSVEVLSDGRIIMIMRTTIDKRCEKAEIPSTKYYSISSDNGYTWSEPKPLRYTDNEIVYSPASLVNVFRSSKNGRLYMITNILDKPTYGCDPRNIIQIAEIDTDTFKVIKETVTVIDKRKPEEGEPEFIRFSNFRWYEDRETKDIVLLMTPALIDPGIKKLEDIKNKKVECPMHSYRYDIHLPEE
ncbi:MAG: sialidase family protein [bacterium]|nr:sialidase family protein [bacterium]